MIIPVVMQPDWFKKFVKVKNIYFFITAGYIPEWPDNIHKALTIFYISPFSDTNHDNALNYI